MLQTTNFQIYLIHNAHVHSFADLVRRFNESDPKLCFFVWSFSPPKIFRKALKPNKLVDRNSNKTQPKKIERTKSICKIQEQKNLGGLKRRGRKGNCT
jgi:hypothetical protein